MIDAALAACRPGPYSERREANVRAFADWYVERMRAAVRPAGS